MSADHPNPFEVKEPGSVGCFVGSKISNKNPKAGELNNLAERRPALCIALSRLEERHSSNVKGEGGHWAQGTLGASVK